jgi:hypothetical protein
LPVSCSSPPTMTRSTSPRCKHEPVEATGASRRGHAGRPRIPGRTAGQPTAQLERSGEPEGGPVRRGPVLGRTLLLVIVAAALAACAQPVPSVSPPVPSGSLVAGPPSPTSRLGPAVHMSNGTTLVVTVLVNGQHVGDVSPGTSGTAITDTAMPPLPWTIEARSRSGRLLTSFQVGPADGSTTATIAQLVDLSCGRLWIWVGGITPDAPVPPSPGKPGDCAP